MNTRRDNVVWWLAKRDRIHIPTDRDLERLGYEADDLLAALDGEANSANPTSAELSVLHLFVQGLTGKEIAQRLGRSPNTVNSHLVSVRRRYGVTRTADAVAIMQERGIL